MSPDDHEERRVGIYFGPSAYTSLTKEEVGEFIKNRMGLIRSDGGPKWTEGLTELINWGMEAWDEGLDDKSELKEEVGRLNQKLDEYQTDIEKLSAKVEQGHSTENLVDTAKQVYRTEARILEILSRDEYLGVKSPNYVDWNTVSRRTGLDQYTVVYYAQMLAQSKFGNFVEIDRMGDNVRLTDEDAFKVYCNQRKLNTDEIRQINDLQLSE